MANDASKADLDPVIAEIEQSIEANLASLPLQDLGPEALQTFYKGKFLRSRLGLALSGSRRPQHLITICGAVELVHSASLIHDDIIDGAKTRRGAPTWFERLGSRSAVILGDYLFSTGLRMMASIDDAAVNETFAHKLQEMCEGEFEQECLYRGRALDADPCHSINRKKTGALFAMTALAAAGGDEDRGTVFEDIGYMTGAAYQSIDDLLDEFGSEATTGKTLGTDKALNKPTVAQAYRGREADLVARICEELAEAQAKLESWPDTAAAFGAYISAWFDPYIERLRSEIATDQTARTT